MPDLTRAAFRLARDFLCCFVALQVFAVKDSNAAPSTSKPSASKAGQVPASKTGAHAKNKAVATKILESKTTKSKSAAAVVAGAVAAGADSMGAVAAPSAPVESANANADSPVELPAAFLSKTNAATAATPAAPQAAKSQNAANKPLPARPVAPKNAAPSVTNTPAAPKATAPVVISTRSALRLRPLYVVGIVAIVALTGVAGAGVSVYSSWKNQQIIAPKVTVAGESVGGLTREKAVARLGERFGKLAFTLQAGEKNVVLGLSDIGGKVSIEPTVDKAFAIGRGDNPVDNFMRVFGSEVKSHSFMLPVEWNRGALTSRLKIVNKQYAKPAVDARLVAVNGAAPLVQAGATGRALDVSATADAIQKSYFLGVSQIKAVTRQTQPRVSAADLEGRDVKLAQYRTSYNGGIAGRTTNIHVACRAVDGQVLMPGEVLSFNGLTGERTYDKGYRMAHIFVRERGQSESSIVDGLAGGVCQVSSTLYNAVRKVNNQSAGQPLQIVERSSHSLPVAYVPSGRDATVAWPSRDFKFRNRYDFPIYVRTQAGDNRLTISIWGRAPHNQAVPVALQD